MELTLENQHLRVEITSVGAELMSIQHKASGREYLWEGEPAIWGRRSPILFPNCGAVKHGGYTIEGKQYPASQHGFARDLNHKVVCASDRIAAFRLEGDGQTAKWYPYKFALKTTYKLDKNSIICQHKVINYDDKPIYFSMGFHTGIRCPFVPGTSYTDYDVVFEKVEDCTVLTAGESGFVSRNGKPYRPDSKVIPVTHDRFSGSLVLKDPTSRYIQLQERNSGDYVRITGTDAPYTVIWATPADVRTLCVEPWYGIGDMDDFDGDFSKKDGINYIDPMEEWTCQQIIEIGNVK